MTPFDSSSYKTYINTWILSQPKKGHGVRSVIAKQADCNAAYVTQVLSGEAHFSLEQAEKLRPLLGLNAEETDFFLLLVEKDRAGTANLKKFFNEKIDKILNDRRRLENRIKNDHQLGPERQLRYFSTWVYSAVHMALTVARMKDSRIVAQQLGIDEVEAKEIIQFLLDSGILVLEKGAYQTGKTRFHLPHDSDLILRHHTNWRLQALKAFDKKTESNLHYSSVISISQEDFQKIRGQLVDMIEKTKRVIKISPEETVVSFCLDFFKISLD